MTLMLYENGNIRAAYYYVVFTLDEGSRGTLVCDHSLPPGNYP